MDTSQTGSSFRFTEGGSRQVIGWVQDGLYSARLYVNHGETATLTNGKWKTLQGMKRWAKRTLEGA